jgi:hypothetical protein
MPTQRPFLAMLLHAYEAGGEHAPLVVVMSPSDEDLPVLPELRAVEKTGVDLHPSRARRAARLRAKAPVRDDDPTEPRRLRHPLSSSDERPRARNAVALYVDEPRRLNTPSEHTATGLRCLAPLSETADTDEDLSLTDVRASVLPVVVGVSTSKADGSVVVASSDDGARGLTKADLDGCDLPTWRLPTGTVVLDDALLRVLACEVPAIAARLRLADGAHDVTDPLLRVVFTSEEPSEGVAARPSEIRSSPLAEPLAEPIDDAAAEGFAEGPAIARTLFRAAVDALASAERERARALIFLATLHDPHDALLACALSTLGGAPVEHGNA